MLLKPSLELVKHHIRLEVCSHCAFRPTDRNDDARPRPRSCEETCPLFHQLEDLHERALCVDPMFSRRCALLTEIRQMNAETPPVVGGGHRYAPANPMICYAERVADVIAKTVGP